MKLAGVQNLDNKKTAQTAKLNETKNGTTPQDLKDGKKKLALALTALGIAGAAAACIIVKRKQVPQVKLSDISFSKGSAKFKNGENFTGIIKDTLKNGDTIKMTYKDGIIQESVREGNKNIAKLYQRNYNGDTIIRTKIGDKYKTVNLTQKISEGKLLKEVKSRKIAEQQTAQKSKEAQALFNKPFEDALSHKSAAESAEVFMKNEQEKNKVIAKSRKIAEQQMEQKSKEAQALFNKPFEDALSHKSAAESAEVFMKNEPGKNKVFSLKLYESLPEEKFVINTEKQCKNTIVREGKSLIGDDNVKIVTRKSDNKLLFYEEGGKNDFGLTRIERHPGYEIESSIIDHDKLIYARKYGMIDSRIPEKRTTITRADGTITKIEKDYYRNKKGRLKLESRTSTTYNPRSKEFISEKIVKHNTDGTSETTYNGFITKRDKKGNILDVRQVPAEKSIYDDWSPQPPQPPQQNVVVPVYLRG